MLVRFIELSVAVYFLSLLKIYPTTDGNFRGGEMGTRVCS